MCWCQMILMIISPHDLQLAEVCLVAQNALRGQFAIFHFSDCIQPAVFDMTLWCSIIPLNQLLFFSPVVMSAQSTLRHCSEHVRLYYQRLRICLFPLSCLQRLHFRICILREQSKEPLLFYMRAQAMYNVLLIHWFEACRVL